VSQSASPRPPGPLQAFFAFSERFGSMLSRAFLTLIYFALIGPFALVYKLFADPLHLRWKGTNWVGWRSDNETLAEARRQD
jgi:hypothetical protein